MSDAQFDITAPTNGRGRTIKFTPERMQQIRNLVERGMSREDIATTIGVTVGSLQVTCSRAGISLRRPRPEGGVAGQSAPCKPTMVPTTGNGESKLPNFGNLNSECPTVGHLQPGTGRASIALRLSINGQYRDVPMALSAATITALALTAETKGMRITEFAARLLTDAIEREVS